MITNEWLFIMELDWGLRPVKVLDYWCMNKMFKYIVKEVWDSIRVQVIMGIITKENLKWLKIQLRKV